MASLFAPFMNQADVEMFIATEFTTEAQRASAYQLLLRFQETMINGYSEDPYEDTDSSRTVN